jgi:hypothetical protein
MWRTYNIVTKPKATNGDEGQTQSWQPQSNNIGEAHDCQTHTQTMEMKPKLFVDNRKAKIADKGQTQVANPPKKNGDQGQTNCLQPQSEKMKTKPKPLVTNPKTKYILK